MSVPVSVPVRAFNLVQQLGGLLDRLPRTRYDRKDGVLSQLVGMALMIIRVYRGLSQADLATALTRLLGVSPDRCFTGISTVKASEKGDQKQSGDTTRLLHREPGVSTAKSQSSVDQSYVSKVEAGTKVISWERLELFCQALETTPFDVFRLAEFLAQQDGREDREVLADLLKATSGARHGRRHGKDRHRRNGKRPVFSS